MAEGIGLEGWCGGRELDGAEVFRGVAVTGTRPSGPSVVPTLPNQARVPSNSHPTFISAGSDGKTRGRKGNGPLQGPLPHPCLRKPPSFCRLRRMSATMLATRWRTPKSPSFYLLPLHHHCSTYGANLNR